MKRSIVILCAIASAFALFATTGTAVAQIQPGSGPDVVIVATPPTGDCETALQWTAQFSLTAETGRFLAGYTATVSSGTVTPSSGTFPAGSQSTGTFTISGTTSAVAGPTTLTIQVEDDATNRNTEAETIATVAVCPTPVPTEIPTAAPTAVPTEVPTAAPTAVPTVAPTAAPNPTAAPGATAAPTATADPKVTTTATPTPTEIPNAEDRKYNGKPDAVSRNGVESPNFITNPPKPTASAEAAAANASKPAPAFTG